MANYFVIYVIIGTLFHLLMFQLCGTSNAPDECPQPCTCHDELNFHVNCSNKLLLTPPKTSASTLTLDLSHNALGPALNATFVQMRNLTLIDLSQNALTSLPDCSFSGMLGLITIRLSRNRLTSLPEGLFTDTTKVQHLDLSYNLFSELPGDAFKNLPELRTLDLSHNLIVDLKLGPRYQVFRHIQTFDLSYNHISHVREDSFETATAWEASTHRAVNLAFCRITSIDSGAFAKIPNLQDLDVSGNNGIPRLTLTELIKELESRARNLDRLSLSHMNLTTIVPFFTQVSEMSIKFLNVSFNNINDLPANVFSTIRSLRILDISRNSLTSLTEGFADLVNLNVLNISHNMISSFHGEAVIHLSNIHTLDVSHNLLAEVNKVNFSPLTKLNYLSAHNNLLGSVALPSNTSNLQFLDYHSNRITQFSGLDDAKSLATVDMSDNDLEILRDFLFRGAKFIKVANFSKNSIVTIDHRAFLPLSPLLIDLSHNFLRDLRYSNWVATQKLYLQHNEVIQIDSQTFSGMTGLLELDLSKNRLTKLHDDLFHHLTNLKYINLSYNGLDNVEWLHLFRNLDQLLTLDLGHNNISILTESMLYHLTKVTSLYLQANRLGTIIPLVFRDAMELKLIDLSHNPFICDCDLLAFKDWLKRTKITVLGLYTMNSTAYLCQSPAKRAGIHVLNWDQGDFECNKSVLYLIIVCSVGLFVIFVILSGNIAYRCYRYRKATVEKKKMLKEEEMMKRQAKVANIVKLSNQEIAQAIQEVIARKQKQIRGIYEMTDARNKNANRSGHDRKATEQDKGRKQGKHVAKKEGSTGHEHDVNIRKERKVHQGKEYERLKTKGRAADEFKKKNVAGRSSSSTRHPEKPADENRTSEMNIKDIRRHSDVSSTDQHHLVRHPIAVRKSPRRPEDIASQSRLGNQDSVVFYERDPRLRHAGRYNPYVISSHALPNMRYSSDLWSAPRGEVSQGYRGRGHDHVTDSYRATPIGDFEPTRHGRVPPETDGYFTHNPFASDAYLINTANTAHYGYQERNDPQYHQRRAQSVNISQQDYLDRAPHFNKPPTRKDYQRAEEIRRSHPLSSRAVSQPYLPSESAREWL